MSDETVFIDPKGGGKAEFSKLPLRHLIDSSTNASALANPAVSATRPSTGCISTGKHGYVRFLFGGTDTANETYSYQVIAWYPFKSPAGKVSWIPRVVAKGVVTLGATVAPTDLIATGLLADTITDTLATTRSSVASPTADLVGELRVPTDGAVYMSVEVSINSSTAASADVMAQLADN
jgi:hypothetical protein